MFRLGFVGSIFTTGVVTGQAVNDANRVNRQTSDQLLDNEILVAETKLKKAKASRGRCCGASERTVARLEARLAKLRLVKEDRATFDVVVPPGGACGRAPPSNGPNGPRRQRDRARRPPRGRHVLAALRRQAPRRGGDGDAGQHAPVASRPFEQL